MSTTICHYPWSTLFVSPEGQVFFCCNRAPGPIGSIHERDLGDLFYNSAEGEKIRRDSQSGDLPCFETCVRAPSLKFYNAGDAPYKAPKEAKLRVVHFAVGYHCNVACVMCDQDHQDRDALDPQKVIDAVDWTHVEHVIFEGGEPLVIPAARQIMEYVRDNTRANLSLVTNGLALSERWDDVLMPRNNECRVSLNGAGPETHEAVNRGSKWDKVINNVRQLAVRRDRAGSNLAINLRMTIVPENVRDIPAFIRLGNDEGYAGRIVLGYCKDSLTPWVYDHKAEFTSLWEELLAEVKRSKVSCDIWRLYALARLTGVETRRFPFGKRGNLLDE